MRTGLLDAETAALINLFTSLLLLSIVWLVLAPILDGTVSIVRNDVRCGICQIVVFLSWFVFSLLDFLHFDYFYFASLVGASLPVGSTLRSMTGLRSWRTSKESDQGTQMNVLFLKKTIFYHRCFSEYAYGEGATATDRSQDGGGFGLFGDGGVIPDPNAYTTNFVDAGGGGVTAQGYGAPTDWGGGGYHGGGGDPALVNNYRTINYSFLKIFEPFQDAYYNGFSKRSSWLASASAWMGDVAERAVGYAVETM